MIPSPKFHTVEDLVRLGAAQFERAGIWLGHGSEYFVDEAAELVFFAAGISHQEGAAAYPRELDSQAIASALALIERRIIERVPAAYLTHRMWFAGHEFYVDERVLVPRSPIAELIQNRFAPWIAADQVSTIIDIGTGSGCIAIAAAHAFARARVWASDISEDALAVARRNVANHGLEARMALVRADVWSGIDATRFDLVISNPPYVSEPEMRSLPEEYRREPALGLRGGSDGLDVVRRILRGAAQHLTSRGLLVVEVGDSESALQAAFPSVPFTWLEFERGGGGVFLLTAAEVTQYREMLSMKPARSRAGTKRN